MRPAMASFSRTSVDSRYGRDRPAGSSDALDAPVIKRTEHDRVVREPLASARIRRLRDRDRTATGECDLHQFVMREEADPFAVGREEGLYRSFGPGYWFPLDLVGRPHIELGCAAGDAELDDLVAVG